MNVSGYVSLSVRKHISNIRLPNFISFLCVLLWPLLGPLSGGNVEHRFRQGALTKVWDLKRSTLRFSTLTASVVMYTVSEGGEQIKYLCFLAFSNISVRNYPNQKSVDVGLCRSYKL